MTEQAAETKELEGQLTSKPAVPTGLSLLQNKEHFEQVWRVAQVFAKSQMVPKHFQGKIEDCMIALQMADRLGIDPMMLMQNTYVVNGRPGMEGKLVIALINTRGPFEGPAQFRMEGKGDTRSCTAFAVHAKTKDICEGYCDVAMAKKAGWWSKSGSSWPTLTDLMLQYRSAAFLARTHCPEVMMGMQTTDELRDVIDITPPKEGESRSDGIKARLAAKAAKQAKDDAAISAHIEEVFEGDLTALARSEVIVDTLTGSEAPEQTQDNWEIARRVNTALTRNKAPTPLDQNEPAQKAKAKPGPKPKETAGDSFPALSETLEILGQAEGPVAEALEAYQKAFFNELSQNPMAVHDLFAESGEIWSKHATESELKALGELKRLVESAASAWVDKQSA